MRWLIELEPKKKRNKPAAKIDMALLEKDVITYPDSFQYERAQRFGVSASGIRLALVRLKVSYKKHGIIQKQIKQTRVISRKNNCLSKSNASNSLFR